jgi:hypothetical protein
MVKIMIAIIFLSLGCTGNKEKKHSNDLGDLQFFYDLTYDGVLNELEPDTGWVSNTDCDSLLFSGLACSLGMPVRIDMAEYAPGEIHRRPYNSCYTRENGDQGSKSTISRDMLTGYMACLIQTKDLDALKRLANYGEDHGWIMGEPSHMVSRVFLGANLTGLLGRSVFVLSEGQSDRVYRRTPTDYLPVYEDFERHVQVQGILLQERISGEITGQMFERLQEHAYADVNNPLFVAALGKFNGDQKYTINLLLSQTPCPSYARGEKPDLYCRINWLKAARIVLDGYKNPQ